MKDITIILKDKPGSLAKMTEILGNADINIEGGCGFPCEYVGILHILVEDPSTVKKLLDDAFFEVRDERDVFVIETNNKPGELAKFSKKLTDAGINMDLFHIASNNRLVFGVDNFQKASEILQS